MNLTEIIINPDLPIARYEHEIIKKFENSSNLILIGETGSGKTTQIPLMLMKYFSSVQDLSRGKIAVTQPRRVAATSVSTYVASLMGEEIGNTVGYKIRFSEATSPDSKLIFMTDGIMLREAQLDPLLLDYSVIMVDEAHERNLNSDFLIGLLIDIQKERRSKGYVPLKILVTSATLEKDKFEAFFMQIENEPLGIIEVPGRLYPITSSFEKNTVYDYEQKAATKVLEICKSGKPGDILIFMPGKREISKTKEAIEYLNGDNQYDLELITIHGNLPIEEQSKIFKDSGKRKVVIATNIAETSITVPGVVHVIDSGLIKQMEYNPDTGIKSLITHFHSTKGLEQRMGRAGRVEAGYYHALFTQQSFKDRPEFSVPEILRSSLSQVVLIMKRIGIDDLESFRFVDQPNLLLLQKAIQELQQLGALDKDQAVTPKGITMANLPLDPKLSNLIIEAQKQRCVESICTICAFLELKPIILSLTLDDILKRIEDGEISVPEGEDSYPHSVNILNDYEHKTKIFEYSGSDFFTILKIWNKWVKNGMSPEWAEDNYLSLETLTEGTNIRDDLLQIVTKSGYQPIDMIGNDLYRRIEKTLISAFKHTTLIKQQNGFYQRINSNMSGIRLHNSSVLRENKPFFALAYEIIEINEIDSQPKLSAKTLHTVEESLIKQYFPNILKRRNKDFKKFKNNQNFKNSKKRKFRFNKKR